MLQLAKPKNLQMLRELIEREDYQFYSLDSRRVLKAAHGIKMSK